MEDVYTDICEKLSTLQWLMKRYQISCQSVSSPFTDTTRGQGRILAMLKIQPAITTKELVYLLGIRQQSLNELLNKMEKKGYIIRKPSESDKRVMIVHLTEKGQAVPQPQTNHHEILDCLLPEELQQLSEYLDRLIKAFHSHSTNHEECNADNWMAQARERMGNERFEQLMSMRERSFGYREMPHNIPGAERFSQDYQGFIPDRDRCTPFGFRQEHKK